MKLEVKVFVDYFLHLCKFNWGELYLSIFSWI